MGLRRRKRRKNTVSFKTLVFSFVLILLLFSVGYSLLSQNLSIEGTATIKNNIVIKPEFRSENLLLTYKIGQGWYANGKQHYQYEFTLENVGTTNVENWEIVLFLPVDYEYANGWSATYDYTEVGKLIISGSRDNNRLNLNVGQSVAFGVQFSSVDREFELVKVTMEDLTIILGEDTGGGEGGDTGSGEGGDTGGGEGGDTGSGEGGDTGGGEGGDTGGGEGENTGGGEGENTGGGEGGDSTDKLYDITYEVTNEWASGGKNNYQIDFLVTNISGENLSSWQFNIVVPENTEVIQNWTCNYVNQNGVITISNTNTNGSLANGRTVKPGLVLSTSGELDLKIE